MKVKYMHVHAYFVFTRKIILLFLFLTNLSLMLSLWSECKILQHKKISYRQKRFGIIIIFSIIDHN